MEEVENMYLPVLATRGIVVFPNNSTTLEVGRKKSILAVDDANNIYDGNIIIVSQNSPNVNDPKDEDLYKTATLCKVTNVKKNADKSYRIIVNGIGRVVVNNFYHSSGTMYGEFKIIEEKVSNEEETKTLLSELKKVGEEYYKKNSTLTYTGPINEIASETNLSVLGDKIAHYSRLSIEHLIELLGMGDINERAKKLIMFLNQDVVDKQIEDEINNKLKEKFDNQQKEYYLREKIRTIKDELGDNGDDSDKIIDMLEKNPYPENIKKKVKDELKKLDMMQPSAPEASVIRNYLDWVLKTPWYQRTEDIDDIERVERILNEDHYGLEKPKQRIIEYLAVKKLTNSLKAPIICFAGPPGTGKTSLALSIARSLGRNYVKISLGGVSDEAEIRGHRRTYLGSMPGRIIQGMKKAGVVNPVFILDEIDKLGKDYKGDPSNALLDVLDPEQNKTFSDNYLEEPYDLSNVLFIATANYLQNVPAPLLDRLEIIELSSYTEPEKLQIAKEFLIKKQLKQNGLEKLDFDEDCLLEIIRSYTREAGVRQLERCIGSICRKVAVKSLKNKRVSRKITKDKVSEYLGKELYDYTKKETKDQIGVVTGLAYTEYGGDILPIEVVDFEGKGNLVLTGNLGNVMKESASVALGYIRANAKMYGINPEFFDKNDIQIHAPEGAVPKDGPSAGVTLTTALISSITNKPVRSDIAMTGEITLRGNVLAIGGLREKSIAALRSGIKTIFIPKDNVKNIEDIPESVRNELEIIPVSHINEIIEKVIL